MANAKDHVEDKVTDEAIVETAALDTLHPGAMPVGPANKSYAAAVAVKAINAMGPETINKFLASIAQIGHEADSIGAGDAAHNKASIDTKPSAASPQQEGVDLDAEVANLIREDVDKLFEGEEIRPEFKDKFSTLFESALNLRVSKRVTELEEQYEAALDEELNVIASNLAETLDTYLDHAVVEWVEGNAVAIESAIRTEVAGSFMDGLRDLLAAHYIAVPEARDDAIESMQEEIEELRAALNAKIEENMDLGRAVDDLVDEIEKSELEEQFMTLSAGMAETEVDRFRELVESVEFESVEEFVKKASALKEQAFERAPSQPKAGTGSVLFEEAEKLEDEKPAITGPMAHYVKALG